MFQQVIFKNIDPFSVSGEMIISNHKYSMSEVKTSVYSVQMRLVIMNLQKQDLGGYKCISKNSIGDAEGNIRLYGECSWIIRLRGSQTLNFSAFQLLPLPPFMFTYQKEFFFFATTGTPLIIHICTVFFLYKIISINRISLGMLTKENKTKFARNIGLLKNGRLLLTL